MKLGTHQRCIIRNHNLHAKKTPLPPYIPTGDEGSFPLLMTCPERMSENAQFYHTHTPQELAMECLPRLINTYLVHRGTQHIVSSCMQADASHSTFVSLKKERQTALETRAHTHTQHTRRKAKKLTLMVCRQLADSTPQILTVESGDAVIPIS